jgi:hypothetical protein
MSPALVTHTDFELGEGLWSFARRHYKHLVPASEVVKQKREGWTLVDVKEENR